MNAADLYIKAEGKIFKFSTAQILYAEAQGNNVKIVTEKSTVSPTITISGLEGQLPKSEFIRVLETNESKAESDEQRIGMLVKRALRKPDHWFLLAARVHLCGA